MLVVGGSASGLQLAQEIHASGRPVTLAVGRHVRMVRRYRGRDIFAWMDAAGISAERARRMPDLRRRGGSRRCSSPAQGPIDLARLAADGVRVTGRVEAADGGRLALGDGLAEHCAASDARLRRVLARIDAHIAAGRDRGARGRGGVGDPGASGERGPPPRPRRPRASAAWSGRPATPATTAGSGCRCSTPRARSRTSGGVTAAPGLFVLGLRLQCRRTSNFIDGVGRDAEALATAIAALPRRRLAA